MGGNSLPESLSPLHFASGATHKSPDPYVQKAIRLSSSPQGLTLIYLPLCSEGLMVGCSWCAVLMPRNSIYLTSILKLLSSSRGAAAVECKSLLLCRTAGFPSRISSRHLGLSHPTEEAEMRLSEAFCFSYRNCQSENQIKRAVYAWYNNLAFLRVTQVLLVLQ